MNKQVTKVLVRSAALLSLVAAFGANAADADAPKAHVARAATTRDVSLRRQWDPGLAIATQGDAALAQIRADSRAQITQWRVPALEKPSSATPPANR